MKKIISLFFITLCLLQTQDVDAGKGYSSGSKNTSSSSFRPSNSSSSSYSKPSIPSPSKPSITPSKPSTPSKSYSSGNSYSKPVTPSPSKPSASGNNSTAPPIKPTVRQSYTSESKKPTDSFQSLAASEQKKAESRIAYQKATTPKETYKTPKGNTVNIKKDDPKVTQVRNMSEEKWVNRQTRTREYYDIYYRTPQPPVVYYNDSYSWVFWLWLLDSKRSTDDRAYWAYHHRNDMDEMRYKDLLAKDAKLEARVKELEAENKGVRNSEYVPKQMENDPDLQYDDDFIDVAFNPEPKPKPQSSASVGGFFYGLWRVIVWCFKLILTIVIAWVLIYFIFYKKWK